MGGFDQRHDYVHPHFTHHRILLRRKREPTDFCVLLFWFSPHMDSLFLRISSAL